LGREVGEPIEPARYDVTEARDRAKFLGSYLTAAMEQQRPQPEEGGEILREWWRWSATPPSTFTDVMTSWDMKLKDKEAGDYVVGTVGGRIGAEFWIIDMIRGQFSQLQTKIAIALMALRHPDAKRHLIENTGNGPEVMVELRRGDPMFTLTADQADKVGVAEHERASVQAILRRGLAGLIAVNVKQSKLIRARAVAAYIEGGNVHLIENKAWAHALVDEWAAFPPKQGGHDDIVDSTSQLLSRLAKSRARIKPPPGQRVEGPKPGARALPPKPTVTARARARVLN
jgi:phage terminase large subunit-like protein